MTNNIPGSLHGACTRQQATAALGTYGVRRAIRTGLLITPWRRVVIDANRRLDPRTLAAAALLAVGPTGALCGFAAASLHGCQAGPPGAVDVVVPYDTWPQPRSGLVMHNGRVSPEDTLVVDGLRVLALDLVISELLCTARSARAALACADQACELQPAAERAEFVAAVTSRLDARPDRRGTVRAFGLAALITAGVESPPESWLRLLVVENGFPPPVVQHEVCDLDGVPLWRLDLAWPAIRVGLEYDGHAAHAGRQERDLARDEDLRRRGWIIIRVRADDLRDSQRVLTDLAAAFHHRGGLLGKTA